MSKESPSYYAIIPASVRYSAITPNAKLLYGELTALCSKEGYCWANNTYFAKLYDVHVDTITSWIGELKGIGVINVGVKGPKRIITLPGEKTLVGRRKRLALVGEKTGHSITPSSTNNNTSREQIVAASGDGNKDIPEIIFLFQKVNPSYKLLFGRKGQRDAVARLLKQWPRPRLDKIVMYLEQTNGKKYYPTITTPIQLEEKLGMLIAEIQRERSKTEKGGVMF